MVKRLLWQSFAVTCLVALDGCGREPQAQISGTVTYEGQPLSTGTVMAFGQDGTPHYSQIAKDGRYWIEAIPPGRVIWAVTSPDPYAQIVERPRGTIIAEPTTAAARSPDQPGAWFPIPSRYAATSTSKLQGNFHEGANEFNISLTK